jgi:hypothetical protein
MLCSKKAIPNVVDFRILTDKRYSDHAPLHIELSLPRFNSVQTLERARLLGSYAHFDPDRKKTSCLKYNQISPEQFKTNLTAPPHANATLSQITDTLITACIQGRRGKHLGTMTNSAINTQPKKDSYSRWLAIIASNDAKTLWQAIDWNGRISDNYSTTDTPNDSEFQGHFKSLLYSDETPPLFAPQSRVQEIPILDGEILPQEVERQIRNLKANKAPGPDGLPPGIIKLVPEAWINQLTIVFNKIFDNQYPREWCLSKLITIYKKGDKMNVDNYRGISIMNALAKLYDSVLNYRLSQWCKPLPEQAGAQKGRGCVEQITTLRILIETARHTKQPLYIVFIDFSKAYDNVNRQQLLNILARKGCSQKFLAAITDSLRSTTNIIGTEEFEANRGVRQGAPASCLLFTLYIDIIAENLNKLGDDGWIKDIHSIMLMDDTAIIGTSRESVTRKLETLIQTCNSIEMKLNPSKCHFVSIATNDKQALEALGVKITHVEEYVYLGSPIGDFSWKQQIKRHIQLNWPSVNKFSIFISRNNDLPLYIKKQVWEAAMISAILYSSEGWLTTSFTDVEHVYNTTIKELIGVRAQTPNHIARLEMGLPSATVMIKCRQKSFLRALFDKTDPTLPLLKAIAVANAHASPVAKVITDRVSQSDIIAEEKSKLKNKIRTSVKSRDKTYCLLNPSLDSPDCYKIPMREYDRKAVTRIRTGSHRLMIEKGRWYRLRREDRLCECGAIQDELHVLQDCPLLANERRDCDNPLFNIQYHPEKTAKFCSLILNKFN